MFITRSKLFLRNFFPSTKRKIVSEFPPAIKSASITIALQIAISSVRERRCIVVDEEVLLKLAIVDVLFISELMMVFGWILWQSIHQRESPAQFTEKNFFIRFANSWQGHGNSVTLITAVPSPSVPPTLNQLCVDFLTPQRIYMCKGCHDTGLRCFVLIRED